MAGLIPWFFMTEILSSGTDVFHKYSYLVNKIKFPLDTIPTIRCLSSLLIHLALVLVLILAYFLCGQIPDIHLIQIPFAIILMFIFFNAFSLLISSLAAFSKDVKNFINTLSTPLFWLSGIIFDIFALGIDWLETLLMFNPVAFFVVMFRSAIYDQIWIWERPEACIIFLFIFITTLALAIFVFNRTKEEIADVL